jgi:aminoglycoside phosphotransferase family enzyme/predicted kinase
VSRDVAADPQALAEAVGRAAGRPVTRHETHISIVFVAGDLAYKLKKPVVLPFLDYGTPQRRRRMCEEEVRLNRRLAPDIYLGVQAVVGAGPTVELAPVDAAAAIDYLVVMRRYDDSRTLAGVLATAACGGAATQIEAVGRRLAEFHNDCPPATGAGGARAVRHEFDENVAELVELVDDPVLVERIDRLARGMRACVRAHRASLDGRARDGLVREVHGDLRAEHVLLGEPPEIVDCVEFDPVLRTLDVADDLAFLIMDLVRRGAPGAARALVRAYREAGGSPGPDELLALFAIHRALIRLKVEAVRDRQRGHAGRNATSVAGLLAVAERCAWQARGARALVVCGLPASGKSRLASELGARFGVPVLNSDRIRKERAGLPADARGDAALYDDAHSLATYAELGRRAGDLLAAEGGVIVDATCRRRDDRDALTSALGAQAARLFVECLSPVQVRLERAAAREGEPGHVSDATPAVVERERRSWAELDEIPAAEHVLLRTDRGLDAIIDDLLALLDERLGANGPTEAEAR